MDGIGPYRSFGMLHCPECFQRTEFVSFDTTVENINDAECCICGYSFGYVKDDTRPTEPARGVINNGLAMKAAAGHLRFHKHVLHSTDIDPDLAEAYEIAARSNAMKLQGVDRA